MQDDQTTKDCKRQSLEGNNKIYIGRASDCAIRIDYPDVSEHHAILEKDKGKWFLRDNNSERGTYYKLKKTQDISEQKPSASFALKHRRVFMVQRFVFIFLENEENRPSEEEENKRNMEIDLDNDF